MSDGAIVRTELDELAGRLDVASKDLYRLEEELDPLEDQYDDLFNDLLTSLLAEYEEDENRRLPGEDVRNALVTKKIRERQPEIFGHLRRKRKEHDRKERLVKRIERQISSKQSILSSLKTEMQAVGA